MVKVRIYITKSFPFNLFLVKKGTKLHQQLELELQKQPLELFCKNGVLKKFAKFTGMHLCQSLVFYKSDFIKKEALAKVLSRGFCEGFLTAFLTEHLWTTVYVANKPVLLFSDYNII